MIKFILCASLAISTFLISQELYSQRLKSVQVTGALGELISKLISELKFSRDDVYSLCEGVFKDAPTCLRKFSQISGGDFKAEWEIVCSGLESVEPRDIELLRKVGSVLGSYDLETQTEMLATVRDEFLERYKKRLQEVEGTAKIYKTLGALSGLGLSIMLI